MPLKKISCIKCSLNKTNYISSDDDDSAVAMHSDDSEDDFVVISYNPTSLKQDEKLGNSLEFYFQYFGSVDEVINIKFLRKDFFCFVSFLLNNKKGTEKECYYKNIMNSYNFSNI